MHITEIYSCSPATCWRTSCECCTCAYSSSVCFSKFSHTDSTSRAPAGDRGCWTCASTGSPSGGKLCRTCRTGKFGFAIPLPWRTRSSQCFGKVHLQRQRKQEFSSTDWLSLVYTHIYLYNYLFCFCVASMYFCAFKLHRFLLELKIHRQKKSTNFLHFQAIQKCLTLFYIAN